MTREIKWKPLTDWTNYVAWAVCLVICVLSLYGAYILIMILFHTGVWIADWFARSLWPMFWGK